MNNLILSKEEFENNIKDVIQYIHCITNQVEIYENIDKVALNKITTLDTQKKTFLQILRGPVMYNAVIISLYGCFEDYLNKISAEYLDVLKNIVVEYDKLPRKIKEKHIKKVGEFLSNPQRYSNYQITERDVISNLYGCMENKKITLTKQLLLAHSGNMKIKPIVELLLDLGIENAQDKIIFNNEFMIFQQRKHEIKDDDIKQYIENRKKDADALFEELNCLVDQRNRVAHSWCVESRISMDMILDNIVPFIKMLGNVICDVYMKEIIKRYIENGNIVAFDEPIEVYNNEILCINSKDAILKQGGCIYACGGGDYYVLSVEELEIDRESVMEIRGGEKNIGIKVNKKIKKNWKFYYKERVSSEKES